MCGLAEHGLRMSAAAPRQGMSPYRRMIRTTTIPARSRDPRSPPHRSPPPPLPPLQSCCRRNIRALPRLLRSLRPPTPRVRAPAGCRVRGASRRAPRSDRGPMEPLSWPFSPPQHPCAPPALSGAPRRGGGRRHVRVARSVSTVPHTRRCVLAHSTRGQEARPWLNVTCRVRARAALRATRGARGASLSRPSGKRGGAGVGWGRAEARWAACANSPAPARSRSPRASACTSWRPPPSPSVRRAQGKEGRRGAAGGSAALARQCGVERREVDGGATAKGCCCGGRFAATVCLRAVGRRLRSLRCRCAGRLQC